MSVVYKNLIGGDWLAGADVSLDLNPSDTRDIIGEFAQADLVQVDLAIAAAVAAQPAWRRYTAQQRHDVLKKIGDELLQYRQAIGTVLSREEGKTLPEGIAEVVRAGHIFLFFAAECLRLSGELLPSLRAGIEVAITREPLGVVGIITPWNFPAAIPAWKIAPALAYGNAVVFKPADLVPATAWALAEIISRSGLPKGVFNLVMGRGSVVGARLCSHPLVRALSFTGSVATGHQIAAACVQGMKKFQLEMGGKNPLVVLNDADLGVAVEAAVQGSYFSTGQRCTASSRLIVTAGIALRFRERLLERLRGLRVGHALDADTQIGPVVSETQLAQNLNYVELGRAEGATLVLGGERLRLGHPGYYMAPTLLADVTPTMRVVREEIFGPVATLEVVADYEAALASANDSEFGLAAGICTSSLKLASHFRAEAQAGMVMVNLPTAGVDYHVPFGGSKASSYGAREQGRHAAEFYTSVKTAYVAA